MRHYPASNLTSGHPNSLQQVKPKGAVDWTSLINDELCYVMDSGTLRIFKFVAASVLSESIPDVVIPDGNATGTGRWEQQEFASGAAAPTVNRFFTKPTDILVGEYEGDIWTEQRIATGSNAFIGSLVRYRSDAQWVNTVATSEGGIKGKLGLTLSSGTGTGKDILIVGNANLYSVQDGGFDAGVIGQPIYAAETSGLMSHAIPTALGAQVRIVGYKMNNFVINFDPSPTWIEIVGGGGGG